MKKQILLLAISGMVVASCSNKEQKDYEMAINSNNMNQLRSYIATYPDASVEHLKDVQLRLEELELDSAAFASIKAETNVLTRYQLCESYTTSNSGGLHTNEVMAIMKKDQPEVTRIQKELEAQRIAAEQQAERERILAEEQAEYEERYGYFCQKIRNRIFVLQNATHEQIIVGLPDKKGKGRLLYIHTKNDTRTWYEYEVYDDSEILVNFGGKTLIQFKISDDYMWMPNGKGGWLTLQRIPLDANTYQQWCEKLKKAK